MGEIYHNSESDSITIDGVTYTECIEDVGGADEFVIDCINESLGEHGLKIQYHTDKVNDITYYTIVGI